MTSSELYKLVKQGEGIHLEFKHKIQHPEKVAREIVAFSNTSGGILLIGVDDDGTIRGLKHADEEQFVLEDLIENHIKFPIEYTVERIQIQEKRQVLCVRILASVRKPNYALEKRKAKYGQAYYRVKDQSIQASFELCQILKLKSKQQSIVLVYGDLEEKVMKLFLQKESLTLKDISNTLLIEQKTCSSLLIRMVMGGILQIKPQEIQDLYLPVAS